MDAVSPPHTFILTPVIKLINVFMFVCLSLLMNVTADELHLCSYANYLFIAELKNSIGSYKCHICYFSGTYDVFLSARWCITKLPPKVGLLNMFKNFIYIKFLICLHWAFIIYIQYFLQIVQEVNIFSEWFIVVTCHFVYISRLSWAT